MCTCTLLIPLRLEKNTFIIKFAPRAFLYTHVVYLLMCNCIHIELIYVCLLPPYREAFLLIVLCNKLL